MTKQTSAPVNSSSQNVTVATSFDNQNEKSLYNRLRKYAKEKGLGKEQNVIRLAVSKFLDSEGY